MRNKLKAQFIYIIIIFFAALTALRAQPAEIQNSAELQLALSKLDVLGSVLYIGAHPDDENTGLIAYLSKGRKLRTAYLSLTRGDGGQNLIGSEKGSEIGILRTQELLQARRIDGGEQYFTRAIDFGFSKSPEESFEIWGKEAVLSDVVWVIRNFRPDIIITRFPIGSSGGHGHHTASALLAKEAFSASADPNKFPEQLKYVQPWQTKKLFWNNFRPSPDEVKGSLSVDIGQYNSLLGKSYTEIAAESRSMHKSQGFGVSAWRGPRLEYFQFVQGSGVPAGKDIMDGIDITWSRLKNGQAAGNLVDEIRKSFNPEAPQASLDKLVKLYSELYKLKDNYWIGVKIKELLSIIQSCAGLWMETIADDYSSAPGDEVNIKTTLVNRTANKFKLDKVEFPTIPDSSIADSALKENGPFTLNSKIRIPDSYQISQPYWLIEEPSKGLFSVSDQKMIGMAENPPSVPVEIYLNYQGEEIAYTLPLLYRWNDKVDGELYRPFEIRPPVTVSTKDKVEIFADNKAKDISVILKSNCSSNAKGEVTIKSNGNWKITPSAIPFSFKNKYDEQSVIFRITPPENASAAQIKIELNVNNKKYSKSMVEISHPHIKREVYFPESEIRLVKLNVKKLKSRIGYIMGSGDEIPECLRSMGYDVVLLSDKMLEETGLSQFDAIIAGIRAYNTRERIKYYQPALMEYVKNGGTMIVQYNVSTGLQTKDIGPYPLKLGNDRITVEGSPVDFINPAQQLLNFPNKITKEDFDGWIQERGLNFAEQWDKNYEPVLSGHDPNETDLKGGMLFARYGKGVYIYTGYSWFRQLPAGVPGAYRIFVNMISAGEYNGKPAD